jgi:pimeloyl-ACP methyl ester carboxylesterase
VRLVLLHALPLNGSQWDAQADILPGRTFAPTLYPFGDTMADWAAGVLDATGEETLIVVGNSVGGSCALELARQAPDRVAALVLVEAKAGHRPEPDFRDRFIAELENNPSVTLRSWVNELLGPSAGEDVRERVCAIAEAQSLADLVRGVRVFHGRPDADDVASGWEKPLVLVRGEHDRVRAAFSGMRRPSAARQPTPPKTSRPNRQRLTVPDSGHYVNLEQPGAFNALLTGIVHQVLGAR